MRTIQLTVLRDRAGFGQDTYVHLPEVEMTAENLSVVAGPMQELTDSFESESLLGTKYTIEATIKDDGNTRVHLFLGAVSKDDFDWFDKVQSEIAVIVNPPVSPQEETGEQPTITEPIN